MARLRAPVLPRWLWLWFPPLLAVVVIGTKLIAPAQYPIFIEGEIGLTELATPLVAIIGFVAGVSALRLAGALPLAVRGWILLTTLGCLYFAGEELSWGQQLFRWDTPSSISELNDQNETNLHNMSSWFDQKPRLLLELWVLIGGVVLPLRRLAKGADSDPAAGSPSAAVKAAGSAAGGPAGEPGAVAAGSDERGSFSRWFWPGIECLPTAILAIAIRLPERYKKVAGIDSLPFEIRWSEPQEYYLALFLLLYLLAVRARLRAGEAQPAAAGR